jgi:hypothetical protein
MFERSWREGILIYYFRLPCRRTISTALEGPLTIPKESFHARRGPTAWRFRDRSNIPVNLLKEVAVSFERPRPGSPSSKNIKTSFQLFMVLLGFARLTVSLRE